MKDLHPISPSFLIMLSQVSAATQATADAVYHAAKDGNFVLSLGGDHSIAVGTIAGLLKARPDVGIIWVDAHADINTPRTSHSGNIHGMVLSFLMKLEECSNVKEFDWLKHVPALKPERLVYIGLRDLDMGMSYFLVQLD